MLRQLSKNVFDYLQGGAREFKKSKNIILLYLLGVFAVASLVYYVDTHTDAGLRRLTFKYVVFDYATLMKAIIVCCTGVYFVQTFLQKYRRVKISRGTIFRCLMWSLAILIISNIIIHYIHYVTFIYFTSIYRDAATSAMPYAFPLLKCFIISLIIGVTGFYPFLVFEGDPNPFRNGLLRMSGMRLSLVAALVIIWMIYFIATSGLRFLTQYVLTEVVPEPYLRLDSLYAMAALFYTLRVFFIILSVATITTAYLKATMGKNLKNPKTRN
ncbi:MAG: hypothetical protein SFW62_06675 [Alphaproteobacteria bacterium]|nr:hypothetical protein [Alphaproteobacteria bacterium]